MSPKFALAFVLSTFLSTACTGERSRIYNQLDGDGDGYINSGEGAVLEGLAEHWELLDTNKDGQLDKEEFARFEIEPIAPREKKQYQF